MRYDETANNRTIEVKADDEFELVLAETRTAGYRWMLKIGSESVCNLIGESTAPNLPGIGGTGEHSWKFRAVSHGRCEIALRYARSWESSSGPAKTFRMKVQVRP